MEENMVQVEQPIAEEPPVNEETLIQKAKKAYSNCEWKIGAYVAISLLIVNLVALIYLVLTQKEEIPTQISYLISFCSMYGVAFPIYLLLSRNAEKSVPKAGKFTLGDFFQYFILGESLMMIGNVIGVFVTLLCTTLFHVDLGDATLSNAILDEKSIVFIIFATTFGPIVEEILFRKIFIDRVRKYGDGKAVLVTGVLFGAFHGNFSQFFYATFLGWMLGFIYVKTGKLRNTIALHMSLNIAGSLIPMLLMRNMDPSTLTAELSELESAKYFFEHIGDFLPLIGWGILVLSMTFAGVVLLITKLSNHEFQVNPPEVELPKGNDFKVTCLTIGMLIFVIVTVGEVILSL